jgi:hypothetical protein
MYGGGLSSRGYAMRWLRIRIQIQIQVNTEGELALAAPYSNNFAAQIV